MKKIFCILLLMSLFGHILGQNNKSVRTPKDYLFLADGAYDRQKNKDKGEVVLKYPKYFERLTQDDLSILDKNGFYKGENGYAGAVFRDTRDNTIIISHRGTEFTDIYDLIADAQIVKKTLPSSPLPNPLNILPNPTEIIAKSKPNRTEEEYRQIIDENIQAPSAKKLVTAVMDKYSKTNNIEQTGHSLGGSHAQRYAYEFGTKGVTFDPAGVGRDDCFDISKKENAKQITNYKIHNSIVSSPITTGKNIGTTITIYPTDGTKIKGTSAHGAFDIYTLALNHKTGNFKTGDEVATEVATTIWDKNEKVKVHVPPTAPYDAYGHFKEISIQEKYNGNFGKFKEDLIKANNIQTEPIYNSSVSSPNSVQFCPTDGGHTIKTIGNFLLFDNLIEKGTYKTLKNRDKWYIIINKSDFSKINSDFWTKEFKQTAGTFKFKNQEVEIKTRNEVVPNKPREERGLK